MQVILSEEEWEAMKKAGRDGFEQGVKAYRKELAERLTKARVFHSMEIPGTDSRAMRLNDVVDVLAEAQKEVLAQLSKAKGAGQ